MKNHFRFSFLFALALLAGCSSLPLQRLTPAVSLRPDAASYLASLKKISDRPCYRMDYTGPYPTDRETAFKAILAKTRAQVLCTTFSALDSRRPLVGRNYDYSRHPALLLFTHPPNGFASVSMVDLGFLGYPDEASVLREPERLRYAPYAPLDGMNEWGLTAAVMYMPRTVCVVAPDKETVLSLEALRLILDHSRTVDEALALLSRYNVSFPLIPVHYLVADPAGHSAVVEFVDGRMRVMRNRGPWQAATNFQLYQSGDALHRLRSEYRQTGRLVADADRSYFRYFTVAEPLRKSCGQLLPGQALALLEKAAALPSDAGQWGTQWSVVYDMRARTARLVLDACFRQSWEITLSDKTAALLPDRP